MYKTTVVLSANILVAKASSMELNGCSDKKGSNSLPNAYLGTVNYV